MEHNFGERISRYFLQGVFFLLPFFIIIYGLYFLVITVDDFFKLWLPAPLAFRGMGFLFAMTSFIVTGALVSHQFMKKWRRRLEAVIYKIPVVNTIYESTNDIIRYMKGDRFKQKGQKVVVIRPPELLADHSWEIVGIITQDDHTQLPEILSPNAQGESNKIGVYIPLSYQIGGFTVFFPRNWVHEIDMSFEKALRGTFTGWIFNNKANAEAMTKTATVHNLPVIPPQAAEQAEAVPRQGFYH